MSFNIDYEKEKQEEKKPAYSIIPDTHMVGLAWGLVYGLTRGLSYAT